MKAKQINSAKVKPRDPFANATPEIVAGVIARAKQGDMGAVKLVLDRVAPPLKPRDDIRVHLPEKASMIEQVKALKTAVCEGRLSASEAGVMGRLMALESALTTAAEGGRGLSAEDVIRLLHSEVASQEAGQVLVRR